VFNARRTAVELHNQRAAARITLLIALGGSFSAPGVPGTPGASAPRAARADAPHSLFNTEN
jgi:hypothetical protein